MAMLRGERALARKRYFAALRLRPTRGKTWIRLCTTLLPRRIIESYKQKTARAFVRRNGSHPSLLPQLAAGGVEMAGSIKFSLILATVDRVTELERFFDSLDRQTFRDFELSLSTRIPTIARTRSRAVWRALYHPASTQRAGALARA